MAYRRKQGITRSSTFQEERIFRTPGDPFSSSLSSNSSSLAAQAIRATAAHRDQSSQGAVSNGYASTANGNEGAAGGGLWGVLAKKGKDILEDGNMISQHFGVPSSSVLKESQEGLLYQEPSQNYVSGVRSPWQQTTRPQTQTTYHEDQLKASRDVAMATAAKAKLLLRELKTVKADLAFAKQRCSQLEEENKMLREAREKGDHPADDDMIRLQLETLLAEKARLAHENSVYARENLILREIVEYHQLTMQDVVYLDEGIEEVTEVSPIPAVSRMLSASPPLSPRTMHKSPSRNSLTMETTPSMHKSPSRNSLTMETTPSMHKSPSRNSLTMETTPSMHKSPSRNSLTKETTPPSSYTSTSKGKDLTRQ